MFHFLPSNLSFNVRKSFLEHRFFWNDQNTSRTSSHVSYNTCNRLRFLHLQLLQAFQARSQKRSAYTLHMDEISPALSSMKGSAVYMPGQTHFSGKVTYCFACVHVVQEIKWFISFSGTVLNDWEYRKIMHVNCRLRNEYESDLLITENYSSSGENKAWKNAGVHGIWTHDLCDTGAVLYQHVFIVIDSSLHGFFTNQHTTSSQLNC